MWWNNPGRGLPNSAPGLWHASQGGDKGIFARRLAQWGDREAIATIRDRYEKDGEFRGYVLRYSCQCRALMRQAVATDPDGMLSTTILPPIWANCTCCWIALSVVVVPGLPVRRRIAGRR